MGPLTRTVIVLCFLVRWSAGVPEAFASTGAKLPANRMAGAAIWLAEAAADTSCPSGFVSGPSARDNLESAVHQINFSPACVWKTIRRNAQEYADAPVRGFSFGTVLGLSKTLGYTTATELAVMKYDDETLIVGRVKVRGGGFELTLPAGVSRTQSVLFGDCEHSLFSYLGWYETVSGMAMSRSWSQSTLNPLDQERSTCDAIVSTRGLTAAVAGISISHYSQFGKWVLVKGPRVKPMIDYIDFVNLRRFGRK